MEQVTLVLTSYNMKFTVQMKIVILKRKKLIATINDINTVSTIDNAPPLSYRACYFVRVLNNVGKSRNSNNLLVDLPGGNLFNFIPHDMLVHPPKRVCLSDRSFWSKVN